LVGDAAFETASHIYTGYGEKVSQGKVRNRGTEYTQSEFPLLDYVNECHVVAEKLPWSWHNSTSTSASTSTRASRRRS
jgi:hypothetical protein